jgi:hypothetical protein
MQKVRKPLQIYAVLICVIAVITFIINIAGITSALLNKSDPLHSGYNKTELSSLENYKMETLKSVKADDAFVPDGVTLEKMYSDAKNDHVSRVNHQANSSITTNAILAVIVVILFIAHWLLLKRVSKEVAEE